MKSGGIAELRKKIQDWVAANKQTAIIVMAIIVVVCGLGGLSTIASGGLMGITQYNSIQIWNPGFSGWLILILEVCGGCCVGIIGLILAGLAVYFGLPAITKKDQA